METKISTAPELEYFIKARVGEPITAMTFGDRKLIPSESGDQSYLEADQLVFGSISGYVGSYRSGKVTYDKAIYNEMIRDVQPKVSKLKGLVVEEEPGELFSGSMMDSGVLNWGLMLLK